MNRFFPPGSNEEALLLSAARLEPAVRVDGAIDVERVERAAIAESVAGLLARSVDATSRLAQRGTPVGADVDELRRRLRPRSFAIHARALTMLDELQRIVRAFRDASIPILVFKGPMLGQQLYGDAGARSYGDLDVIVSPSEARAGERLLRDLGYVVSDELTPSQERVHRRFNSETSFYNAQRRVVVDFHWRFTNVQFPFDLPFETAWARHTDITIDDFDYPTLCDLDLVLMTVTHAAKHLWSTLEAIASVGALRQLDVDWDAVEREAEMRRVQRQLGLSCLIAEDVLGVEMPPLPRARRAATQGFPAMRGIVRGALFHEGSRRCDAGGSDLFVLLDRRSDVYRALLTSVFAPTFSDWRESSLPGPLHWLARPFRLLAKYLKRA